MIIDPKWDIADEVASKKSEARPMSGKGVVSSAVHVVFAVLTFVSPSIPTERPMEFISRPSAVVEVVRVPRNDSPSREQLRPATSQPADTRVGMSTGKLADLFPKLFEPAQEEADGGEFFLS